MLLICNSYPEVKLLWCSEVSQIFFFSYLKNRAQFFTINSDIKDINNIRYIEISYLHK